MKSNCCNAEMKVGGDGTGERATHFWICDNCQKACDPQTISPGWYGTPLDWKDHWVYKGNGGVLYNSFWKTVISSPQWQAWEKKHRSELRWDTAVCEECGWISEQHFQEFLQFVILENGTKLE